MKVNYLLRLRRKLLDLLAHNITELKSAKIQVHLQPKFLVHDNLVNETVKCKN